jgi:hypothetical protein
MNSGGVGYVKIGRAGKTRGTGTEAVATAMATGSKRRQTDEEEERRRMRERGREEAIMIDLLWRNRGT